MPPRPGMDESDGLFGSWSATRWEYACRAHPERRQDVVCDLGGSVTLSLSEENYVLTWDVGSGSRSVGGRLAIRDGILDLRPRGSDAVESLRFRFGGGALALSSDDSGWDFGGDGGEEPAAFVAVFVRL